MTTTEIPKHLAQADLLRRRADGLRRLADLVEAHPEIRASYVKAHEPIEFNVWHAPSPGQLAAIARAAMAFGAKVDKDPGGDVYVLRVSWGGVTARALAARDSVCERVQTGVETVTRTVPDPAAPLVEITEEIPTYEWKCRSLLADGSGKDSEQ